MVKHCIHIRNKANFLLGLLIIALMAMSVTAFSQELTQTVKGRIIDSDIEIPLPGATVILYWI